MRILIIGINYLPEQTGIGPYTAGVAAHLAGQDHEVDVLTGLPSYPEWRIHRGYRRLVCRTERIDEVNVHRRWHYVPQSQTALRRLSYEASFLLTGLSFLRLPKPDLVLGVIPTLSGGLLARAAGRYFKVPYAVIFQDLMGPAASQAGVIGASHVTSFVTAVERWIANGAAGIAVIAEGYRTHLSSLGVDPDKVFRIRNWTRINDPTEAPEVTRRRLGWDEFDVVCLHSGNMGHKQGLENILECARLAKELGEKFHFVLMGDGNKRMGLEQIARQLRLTNVEFLPLQSDRMYSNVLSAADILLLNQREGVSEMALPSKLTSYMWAGRPVIAAVEPDSETAKELAGAGAGIVLSPNAPTVLLDTIKQLSLDQRKKERLGRNGQHHARRVLSAEAALKEIERFVAALA